MNHPFGGATGRIGRTDSTPRRFRRRLATFASALLAPSLFASGLASQQAPNRTTDLAAKPGATSPRQTAGAAQAFPYQAFAVHIFKKPRQSWPGFGIYLGDGLVLTAAHVVGRHMLGDPSVEIAGQTLESEVVKEGDFETVDLTLLHIDPRQLPPSIGMRQMPLCQAAPRIGQPVVVATPEALSTSHILSPKALPPNMQIGRFDSLIADVETTGNSGSGVFDPTNQCLMGIMSRKFQISVTDKRNAAAKPKLVDVAKYFVPARDIATFIGKR